MKMTEGEFKVRTVVNGAILKQNLGKHVSVTGTVLSTEANGSSFELKTTDKHIVTVSMRQPLSEPLSGLVEVHGIANTKASVICDYYIGFPKELEDTFDADILNETVVILNNVQNAWQP